MAKPSLSALLRDVAACRICEEPLPVEPRPVVQIGAAAKVLIAGQAPGRRVFETGVAFDDPSGDRLRAWMGVSTATFYDASKIAILPMGFCYPGTGKTGDLAPRPECAEAWREQLLARMTKVKLTLVIGQYAMRWHLPDSKSNLTETVRAWKEHRPRIVPLPHPSPRNNRWLAKNPWFQTDVLPYLRRRIATLLA